TDELFQVVADRLLVERGLRPAGPVLGGGPEPGGVRREDLVHYPDETLRALPELELGVGYDDATFSRDVATVLVQHVARASQLLRHPFADEIHHLPERYVFVMSLLRLRRGGEDGGSETFGFRQAGGQLLTRERTRGGVLLPRRAREIATHHTLH